MPLRLIKAAESTAAKRRLFFQLVGTDGITAATGEAGGQPQVSLDGAAWAGSGSIGTLTHVGNGRYYADLASASVASSGVEIESRYKSASTAECPGDSALVVAYDPYADIASILALLNSGGLAITITSPVPDDGGTVELVYGDDYALADGRQLSWTADDSLDLTGATVNLVIYNGTAGPDSLYTLPATVTPISGGYTLTRSLTAAQTTAMGLGKRLYELKVTTSGGNTATILSGTIRVSV